MVLGPRDIIEPKPDAPSFDVVPDYETDERAPTGDGDGADPDGEGEKQQSWGDLIDATRTDDDPEGQQTLGDLSDAARTDDDNPDLL